MFPPRGDAAGVTASRSASSLWALPQAKQKGLLMAESHPHTHSWWFYVIWGVIYWLIWFKGNRTVWA